MGGLMKSWMAVEWGGRERVLPMVCTTDYASGCDSLLGHGSKVREIGIPQRGADGESLEGGTHSQGIDVALMVQCGDCSTNVGSSDLYLLDQVVEATKATLALVFGHELEDVGGQ